MRAPDTSMREERRRLQLAKRVLQLVRLWSGLSGRTCTWLEASEVAEPDVPLQDLMAAVRRNYEQYKPSTLSYFRRMALDMETECHKHLNQERQKQKGSDGFVSAAELTKPFRQAGLPLGTATGRKPQENRPATTSQPSEGSANQQSLQNFVPEARRVEQHE